MSSLRLTVFVVDRRVDGIGLFACVNFTDSRAGFRAGGRPPTNRGPRTKPLSKTQQHNWNNMDENSYNVLLPLYYTANNSCI